jgi:hypothetical protein
MVAEDGGAFSGLHQRTDVVYHTSRIGPPVYEVADKHCIRVYFPSGSVGSDFFHQRLERFEHTVDIANDVDVSHAS